jgi:1-acyl-sn-glycerol-3-phosphate acyltransferase
MEPWHYQTAEDLDHSLAQRLKDFPREPDMLVYGLRCFAAAVMRAWLRLYHRFEVRGREHLPEQGSFVLVANHQSHLDAPCLLSALPFARLHRTFPAAAADYFFVSLPRAALASVVVNALPFSRTTDVRQSLDLCKRLLDSRGNVLILFPEGTRSVTGELGLFRPGIGALLAGSPVPAVPCWLQGTGHAWPKGRWLPRPGKVRLTLGPPRSFAALPPGRPSAERIAAELQEAIRGLGTLP